MYFNTINYLKYYHFKFLFIIVYFKIRLYLRKANFKIN